MRDLLQRLLTLLTADDNEALHSLGKPQNPAHYRELLAQLEREIERRRAELAEGKDTSNTTPGDT
jgi:hypothetical protein